MRRVKYLKLKEIIKSGLFLIVFSILAISCESEYSRVVKEEAKKEIVYEDLFFGLKFGQTRKDFFALCWDMNEQKKISHGPGNNYAKFIIESEERNKNQSKIEKLFYGIFDGSGIMRGMDMKFSYLAYAPWNEERHSDKLIEDLMQIYMNEYPGNPFIHIEMKDIYGDAKVKVDGNRQILIYPLNQKDVVVKIEDLRHKSISKKLK